MENITVHKLIVVLVVVVVLHNVYRVYNFVINRANQANRENFYNILPTELIDGQYNNINEDPYNYNNHLRVGDLRGVDLNCNNVNKEDIIAWIRDNNPHMLHQYVYIYDPSIDINNPIYTPRVLKMLLRNLPEQHPFIPILQKCFPMQVRIS